MNSLFSREYGYQHTRYEFESMRSINDSKVKRTAELKGYIRKVDDYYILTPTSTLYPYIICRSDKEIRGKVEL